MPWGEQCICRIVRGRLNPLQTQSTAAWLSVRPAACERKRLMTWTRFSHGLRLDPIAGGAPEALVVLLQDLGAGAATLTLVAARWAAAVPTTAFIALDRIAQRDPPPTHTTLDRASRHLAPLLEHQLRARRLDAGRLVLVGFGHGGTLALHMVLH